MSSKSVRVAEDTFERLQQLAEEEDRPMARIVGGAIELYDSVKLAKVARAADPLNKQLREAAAGTSEGTKTAPKSPKSLVAASPEEDTPETAKTGCPHPSGRRKVLSWGTICADCGAVIK